MADKDITIGIKGTGGDQAAAEIGKVNKAVASTSAAGQSFQAAGQKVTTSSVNMRGAVQNTAFQLQDMAVQLEMGTSAVRVFSQQVPQLLGGFGAIGAVAGAVIGIGLPLAAAMLGTGKAAKQSSEDVDAFKEILEDFTKAADDAANARRGEATEEWLKSLDAEEEYYGKINERLERQIALRSKLNALKQGADSAEREARIAEIENDPNKRDADKIREVAAIREEDAKAKNDGRKKELEDAAAQEQQQATVAEERAKREAEDAAAATKARKDLEAELAALAEKAQVRSRAQKSIPRIQGQISAAELAASFGVNPETGETLPGYEASRQEIERLKQELAAAKATVAAAPTKDIANQRVQIQKALEAAKQGEEEQAKQAEEARKAAETAFGKSATASAAVRGGTPDIDRQYEAERRAREARTNAAVASAEERARREADAKKLEAAKAAQEARERALRSESGSAGAAFDAGAEKLPGGKLKDTLGRIAGKLADGTDAAEMDKITREFEKATEGMTGATIDGFRRMLEVMSKSAETMAALQAQMDALEAQTKNNRRK